MPINNIKFLKDISLISIISVLAYALTYVYQLGFAFYFRYPPEYIEVNVDSILKTLIVITFVLMPFIATLGLDYKSEVKVSMWWLIFSAVFSYSAIYVFIFGIENPFLFITESRKYVFIVTILLAVSFLALVFLLKIISNETCGWETKKFLSFLSVIITFVLFLSCGFVAAAKNNSAYILYNKSDASGFVLLSSFGNSLVFGKCHEGRVIFIKYPADERINLQLITSSTDINNYRVCFDGLS
ncbi:hypothetical protein DVP88_08375 [Yersinia enterocolitica]|nr:hypothetical protein [Yersinia enterocolitica]HEN3475780.1 hypothetical protein [Yersinia enterocolitica]